MNRKFVLVPEEPTGKMLDAAYEFPSSTEGRMEKQYRAMINAAPSPWQPIETAPKDGTILLLMVKFDDHRLDDEDHHQVTMGCNHYQYTNDHQWRFVGWDWDQDRFCEGSGEVIGWMSMPTLGEVK